MKEILRAVMAGAGVDDAALDHIRQVLAIRVSLETLEAKKKALDEAYEVARGLIRDACLHPITKHEFEHDSPAPAAQWDRCLVCDKKLNYTPPEVW